MVQIDSKLFLAHQAKEGIQKPWDIPRNFWVTAEGEMDDTVWLKQALFTMEALNLKGDKKQVIRAQGVSLPGRKGSNGQCD